MMSRAIRSVLMKSKQNLYETLSPLLSSCKYWKQKDLYFKHHCYDTEVPPSHQSWYELVKQTEFRSSNKTKKTFFFKTVSNIRPTWSDLPSFKTDQLTVDGFWNKLNTWITTSEYLQYIMICQSLQNVHHDQTTLGSKHTVTNSSVLEIKLLWKHNFHL